MSNALGHIVSVTNRGLHTTSSVNSQQNRLTPDWSDTVTREVPSEAFYLFEPETREWYSPTYHPLNDPSASYEVEFGVDGTAVYRMARERSRRNSPSSCPPTTPRASTCSRSGIAGTQSFRLASRPIFRWLLAGQPEDSGRCRSTRTGPLAPASLRTPAYLPDWTGLCGDLPSGRSRGDRARSVLRRRARRHPTVPR